MAIDTIEDAVMRLYEDSSLTDDLTDNAAMILQQWGETQLRKLGEKHDDSELFEDDFKLLRKVMKGISRYTWRRKEMMPEEIRDYVEQRIIERSKPFGCRVQSDHLNMYLEQQATLDEVQHVQLLTSLLR